MKELTLEERLKLWWRHRKAITLPLSHASIGELRIGKLKIYLDYEIPAAILDTFDALGFRNHADQVPLIVEQKRTDNGWFLVINMPPGKSVREVQDKLHYFEEQAKAHITLRTYGKTIHMLISSRALSTIVPYSFDPTEYKDFWFPLPLGETYEEKQKVVDMAQLPHILVAGETGYGKTTFLLSCSLAALAQGAQLVIVDLKGTDFVDLQGYAIIADTLLITIEALKSLNREMERRRKIFQRLHIKKIQDYKGSDLPPIVCMVDELAELQNEEGQKLLQRLARLCRNTGIHLIVATQRPSYTVYKNFTDLRMLFPGRMCFYMPSRTDSEIVLGNDAAFYLDPNIKGRAIWQFGAQWEVQCMYLSDEAFRSHLKTMGPPEVKGVEQCAERLLPR